MATARYDLRPMSAAPPPLPHARRVIAGLIGLALALAAVVVALLLRGRAAGPAGFEDATTRRAVVEQLVKDSAGLFDVHPDPDVGRILLPGLAGVEYKGATVSTSAFGLREAPFEIPKPAGVVRVVFLGDSFVFGNGVAADERMGVHLARFLEARRGKPGSRIECLHLGIESWNAVAESAYLRRQLDELAPDLVVWLLIANDLDDNMAVRGFGSLAELDVRHPDHVGVRVAISYPARLLGSGWNPLADGLDRESRQRYAELARAVGALLETADRASVPCLLFANWADQNAVLRQALVTADLAGRATFLPAEFVTSREHWVSPVDQHWNSAGHERFARLVYASIVSQGLLPELALAPWPEAEEEATQALARGRRQSSQRRAPLPELRDRLVFADADLATFQHVYTGIDLAGNVAPYTSFVLRVPAGARELALEGAWLPAESLRGSHVTVHLEELALGTLEIVPGDAWQARWPLPDAVKDREFVNVRLIADDWIVTGDDRRDCRSLRLTSATLR